MNELAKLRAQIAELNKQAEDLIIKQRGPVIEDIKAKIQVFNITAKELGLGDKPHSKAGIPVPIKYRHGSDVWTGRGRQPKWMTEYLSNGGTIEEITVKH